MVLCWCSLQLPSLFVSATWPVAIISWLNSLTVTMPGKVGRSGHRCCWPIRTVALWKRRSLSRLVLRYCDVILQNLVQLFETSEDVNADAPVLVRCLQDPVVAANEVAVWHDVSCGALPLEHCSVLGATPQGLGGEVLLNVSEVHDFEGLVLLLLKRPRRLPCLTPRLSRPTRCMVRLWKVPRLASLFVLGIWGDLVGTRVNSGTRFFFRFHF